MVEDHTAVGAEIGRLAKAKGVKLPDKPSLVQRASVKSCHLEARSSTR